MFMVRALRDAQTGKVKEMDDNERDEFNGPVLVQQSIPVTTGYKPLDMVKHHFHVKHLSKNGHVVIDGMFASMYCAAHTANFMRGLKSISDKSPYVVDTLTGMSYKGADLDLDRIRRWEAPIV